MQSDFRIELEQRRRVLCKQLVQHFFTDEDSAVSSPSSERLGSQQAETIDSNGKRQSHWQLLAQPTRRDVPIAQQPPDARFQPVVEKMVLLCTHQESRRFDGAKAFGSLDGLCVKLRANSLLKKAAALKALVGFVREQKPRFQTEVNDNFVTEVLHALLLLGGSPTRVAWDASEIISTGVEIPGVLKPKSREADDEYLSDQSSAAESDDGGLSDWEKDFDETSDEEEVFRKELRDSEALIETVSESHVQELPLAGQSTATDGNPPGLSDSGSINDAGELEQSSRLGDSVAPPKHLAPSLQSLFLAIAPAAESEPILRALEDLKRRRDEARFDSSTIANSDCILTSSSEAGSVADTQVNRAPPSILFEAVDVPQHVWDSVLHEAQRHHNAEVNNPNRQSRGATCDGEDASMGSSSTLEQSTCPSGCAPINLDTRDPTTLLSSFARHGVHRVTNLAVVAPWLLAPQSAVRYELAISWSVLRALRGAFGDLFEKSFLSDAESNEKIHTTRTGMATTGIVPVQWDGYKLSLGDALCRLKLNRVGMTAQLLHLSPAALRRMLLEFAAAAEALQRLRAVAALADESYNTPEARFAHSTLDWSPVAPPKTLQALAACCQSVVAAVEDTLIQHERQLLRCDLAAVESKCTFLLLVSVGVC